MFLSPVPSRRHGNYVVVPIIEAEFSVHLFICLEAKCMIEGSTNSKGKLGTIQLCNVYLTLNFSTEIIMEANILIVIWKINAVYLVYFMYKVLKCIVAGVTGEEESCLGGELERENAVKIEAVVQAEDNLRHIKSSASEVRRILVDYAAVTYIPAGFPPAVCNAVKVRL